MASLTIFNPRYDVQCSQCAEVGPGVILRRVDDPKNFAALCVRCLVLVLQEATRWKLLPLYQQWEGARLAGIEAKQLRRDLEEERHRYEG